MNILIAPNAFKHALPASEVADAICEGIQSSGLHAELVSFPVGDGGDGTAALLARHLGAKAIYYDVKDPLRREVSAPVYFSGDTAIIEMADASGLCLLKPHEYAPMQATSFGTGELITHALQHGARKIMLCIGGSATVDGGTGALQAMGVRFLDSSGDVVENLPEEIETIQQIDLSSGDARIFDCEITILCDVENPLTGSNGSARIFAPQKGADPTQVELLEGRLQHLANVIQRSGHVDIATLKHGGAAGGIAAMMKALIGAKLVSGIDHFLRVTDFEKVVRQADWVITGEGSLDLQTLNNKAPFGVSQMARSFNRRVIGVAGRIPTEARPMLEKHFDRLFSINNADVKINEELLRNTRRDLIRQGYLIGEFLGKAPDHYRKT